MSVGTPVIVTDVKAYKEIGVVDSVNGFILDLNLNNVDYNKIYTANLKFKYNQKEDRYNEILAPGKSTYKYDKNKKCTMEAIKKFTLAEFDKIKIVKRIGYDEYGRLFPGDTFECSSTMAEYLTGDNEKNKVVAKFLE